MAKKRGRPAGKKSRLSKGVLVERIADVLLAEGVASMPLRDLAARIGTSDRMLIYYFGDKTHLIEASISELARRVDVHLSVDARRDVQLTPAELLRETGALMATEEMAAFRMVWADILARGGRGEVPFASIARTLVESSLAQLRSRLAIEDDEARAHVAASILAVIEGMWLIGMVAPGSTEGVLDTLVEGLQRDARGRRAS